MGKPERGKLDYLIWLSGVHVGRRLELFPLYAEDVITEEYLIDQLADTREAVLAEFRQFCITYATEGRLCDSAGYNAKDSFLSASSLGRPLTDEELSAFKESSLKSYS
jgi:hypothetical protein